MFSLQATAIDVVSGQQALMNDRAGAYVSFEGWVRDHNEGKAVTRLEYEAFEALALAEGNRILEEARQKFGMLEAHCIHRTGALAIGECAVWVGVVSAHRDAAFQACRYIIDEVKHRLPIWKKEFYTDGSSVWVNCQSCVAHSSQSTLAGTSTPANITPNPASFVPRPANALTEADYYARQMILPEIGEAGQAKLKQAGVLVIGAGGLGSSALQYLAAAGVGTLGLCEFDTLDASNLHRQVLYDADGIGQSKAVLAQQRLATANPLIHIAVHDQALGPQNVDALLAQYDWILDCTDNFTTKFLLNDVAVRLQKPLIQASVYQYEGQLQVIAPGAQSACLRCQWPVMPEEGLVGHCAEIGVLGVVPGIFGILQAVECLKQILDLPSPLNDHLLLFDLLTFQTQHIQRNQNPYCPLHGAARSSTHKTPASAATEWEVCLDTLSIRDLDRFEMIDIRERVDAARKPLPVSCRHVPFSELDKASLQENLPPGLGSFDSPLLLVCRSGRTTAQLVQQLWTQGQTHVYSLAGGADALQRWLAQMGVPV